ncbi:hypothetical protein JCM8097_001618 [Rhodosporidiobolus ruineniae]
MSAPFVGLPVLVKLNSGPHDSATGVLSSLDPVQGSLTLTECRTTLNGHSRLEGIKVLRRQDVAGLELLSVDRGVGEQDGVRRTQPIQQPAPAPPPQPQPTYSNLQPPYSSSPHFSPSPSPLSHSPKPATKAKRSRRRARNSAEESLEPEPEGGDEADLSTAYGEQAYSGRRREKSATRRQPQGQASFEEDFDFSAGLKTFDKAREFERIRSTDTIDPSLRLVAHNRNPSAFRSRTPQSSAQVKLLPSENVLSSQELSDQQSERLAAIAARASGSARASQTATPTTLSASASTSTSEDEGRFATAAGGGSPVDTTDGGVRRLQSQLRNLAVQGEGAGGGTGRLVTRKGVRVPTIKLRQWKEALSIADIESAPSTFRRLEHSAFSLVHYLLSTLTSPPHSLFPPPSPPSSRPSILLLATDCEKGVVALKAGTLLANRGCRVAVLVEEGEGRSEGWRTGLRVLSSAGGRIVKDIADLAPTYNLLLDALSDPLPPPSSSSRPDSLSASTSSLALPSSPRPSSDSSSPSLFAAQAAEWANGIDTTRVAIDVPFGLSHDSGAPLSSPSPASAFRATHLLALALPRPCLPVLMPSLEGAAVADVGFAPALWARVGLGEDGEEGEGADVRALFGAEGVVEVRLE